MSLLDVLRSAVKIADTVTKPIQVTVTLERMTGTDQYGTIQFGAPIPLRAIEDWARKQVRTQAGELTVTRATVTFLDVAELSAATNGEGIDDNDRITLADGTTGQILDLSGFVDAGTTKPLATEVMLG